MCIGNFSFVIMVAICGGLRRGAASCCYQVAVGLGSCRLRNRQAGSPGRRTRQASWTWQGGRVRRLVYVSGAPAAGKSSLAGPLAGELGFTLITKDTLKETLHDALDAPEPDLAWSRRLGGAAMELLW